MHIDTDKQTEEQLSQLKQSEKKPHRGGQWKGQVKEDS